MSPSLCNARVDLFPLALLKYLDLSHPWTRSICISMICYAILLQGELVDRNSRLETAKRSVKDLEALKAEHAAAVAKLKEAHREEMYHLQASLTPAILCLQLHSQILPRFAWPGNLLLFHEKASLSTSNP